jgi:hypothetical protein
MFHLCTSCNNTLSASAEERCLSCRLKGLQLEAQLIGLAQYRKTTARGLRARYINFIGVKFNKLLPATSEFTVIHLALNSAHEMLANTAIAPLSPLHNSILCWDTPRNENENQKVPGIVYLLIGPEFFSELGAFNFLVTRLDKMFEAQANTLKQSSLLFLCFAPTVSHEAILAFFDQMSVLPKTYSLFKRYRAVVLSVSAFNQNLDPVLEEPRFKEWVNAQSNFWIEPESVYVKHTQMVEQEIFEQQGEQLVRKMVNRQPVSHYVIDPLIGHTVAMQEYMKRVEQLLVGYDRILRLEETEGGRKQYRNCFTLPEYYHRIQGTLITFAFKLTHSSMIYIGEEISEGGGVKWGRTIDSYATVIVAHRHAFKSWGREQIDCYQGIEEERKRKGEPQGVYEVGGDIRKITAEEFRARMGKLAYDFNNAKRKTAFSADSSAIRLTFTDLKELKAKRGWYAEAMKTLGCPIKALNSTIGTSLPQHQLAPIHSAFSIFIPYCWLASLEGVPHPAELSARQDILDTCPDYASLACFLQCLPIGIHIEFDLSMLTSSAADLKHAEAMFIRVLQLIRYIATDSIVSLLFPEPLSEGIHLPALLPDFMRHLLQEMYPRSITSNSSTRFGFKLLEITKDKTYQIKRDSYGEFQQTAELIKLWQSPPHDKQFNLSRSGEAPILVFRHLPVAPVADSPEAHAGLVAKENQQVEAAEEERWREKLQTIYQEIEELEIRLRTIQREGQSALSRPVALLNIKAASDVMQDAYGPKYLGASAVVHLSTR